MTLHTLSALLAAIVTCAIGWSVVFRDRRRQRYFTFAVLCFNLCLWHLTTFLSTTLESPWLFWVSLLLAVGIPANAERFFRAFLAQDPKEPTSVSRPLMLGTGVFVVLLLYSALFHPLHRSTAFLALLFVFVIASLLYSVFLIHHRQRVSTSRPEATRLVYLFYGGLGAVGLSATDFLPRIGVAFPTVGTIFTVIYMYFLSQTLFHFRLLDIKELLAKIVTVAVLVLILTTFYGLLLGWVGRHRPGMFFFNTVVASFVLLVIFDPIRSWIEDRLNRWIFREKYELSRGLRQLRMDLANIIESQALVDRILLFFEESERATHCSVYLADPSAGHFRLAGHIGPQPVAQLEGSTRRLFLERVRETGLLTREGLESDLLVQLDERQEEAAEAIRNLLATLEELHAGVCIPFFLEDQLLGLLNLRDERVREAYSSDELNDLRRLAAQVAITLRNSGAYEKMKERDRLAALGQMAAGLAHEIRNPLGAIKGAAQLLRTQPADPEIEESPAHGAQEDTGEAAAEDTGEAAEDTGEAADKDVAEETSELAEYTQIIVEEVDRLDRVVSQFLGYARPDRGQREAVNINDVVHKTVYLLKSQAGDAEIQMTLAPDLPQVRVDPEQIRQVFLNLGINALQAMEHQGTLRVTSRLRRGSAGGQLTSFVEISFQDSGGGIPPESLSDIFIPFFTTKEGGTGLGLPICQRIVENHKGALEVKSDATKGSEFSVLLPPSGQNTGTQPLS